MAPIKGAPVTIFGSGGFGCADEKGTRPRSIAIQPTASARMIATIASANVERVVFWIMRPAARVLKSDGEANRDQLHNDPRCSKYGT
jgi:hypothetical protein